jgi:hypothetical protein
MSSRVVTYRRILRREIHAASVLYRGTRLRLGGLADASLRRDRRPAIADAIERFKVLELVAIHQAGSRRSTAGASYGDVVVDFPTNERRRMSAACDRFRVGVLEATSPMMAVLARHLGHCVAKETPYGQLVRAMWHAAIPERGPMVAWVY